MIGFPDPNCPTCGIPCKCGLYLELPRAVAEFQISGATLNKFIKDRVFKAQAYPNLLWYATEKSGKTHANIVGIIQSQLIPNSMSNMKSLPRDLNADGEGPALFYIGTVMHSDQSGCSIEVSPSPWPSGILKGVWPGIPTGSQVSVLELLQDDQDMDSLLNDGEFFYNLGEGYIVSLEVVGDAEVEQEGGMELDHHRDLDRE